MQPVRTVELRALTILQPWAALIAHRHKLYETRSWSTKYRGLVVIHAGKDSRYADSINGYRLYDDNLRRNTTHLREAMTFGTALCVARLVDCVLMTDKFILDQSRIERFMGKWEPGRYAWKFDVLYLVKPAMVNGHQGLWRWPSSVKLEVVSQ